MPGDQPTQLVWDCQIPVSQGSWLQCFKPKNALKTSVTTSHIGSIETRTHEHKSFLGVWPEGPIWVPRSGLVGSTGVRRWGIGWVLRAGSGSKSETRRHWDSFHPVELKARNGSRYPWRSGDTRLSAGPCHLAVSPWGWGVECKGRKEVQRGQGRVSTRVKIGKSYFWKHTKGNKSMSWFLESKINNKKMKMK